MFSRSVFRTALEAQARLTPNRMPFSVLTPRMNLQPGSTSAQFQATPAEIPPHAQTNTPTTPSTPTTSTARSTSTRIPPTKLPIAPTFNEPLTLTPSLTALLPQLAGQSPHFVSAHLHARRYLVTEGDTLRLPFLMPDVKPGDLIRLNRASNLGSRDFTLKGSPYIDERLFECRARVIGTEAEPLRIMEKTKRRQRHTKTVRSKHKYTILRIVDVKVKSVDQLLEEGAKMEE